MNPSESAAVTAAGVVQDAALVAEHVVDKASETAKHLLEHDQRRTTTALADALRQVFGENIDSGRFIDVSKIPLICRSITDMHTNLAEMKLMMKEERANYISKEEFWPVRTIVFSGVGLVLVAVVGAFMTIIIQK